MNKEQLEKLKEAISVIENAGGIVLIDEEKIEAEIEDKEQQQWLKEYTRNRKEAKKDFAEMIEKGSSLNSIEDMVLSHGIDLDEIENFIHEMY